MNVLQRRIGLEQEFFLVDETGYLSDRADEFLEACHLMAQTQGLDPKYFVPWPLGSAFAHISSCRIC
ncbi:hypothetical protein [Nostoc sp.]|uniref:hypothetical protein n=1 Tax=Nostoc sp. TaxID=1180 RepID=UPI002FF77F9A